MSWGEPEGVWMKNHTKKKVVRIICLILAVLIAADWVLSDIVYDQSFAGRYTTYEPYRFYVSDFEGLEAERYQFPSDQGQMLTGYLYHQGTDQKAIVVIGHGLGGGGHNSYMDAAACFAQHGFYVFAFDATACDESEGDQLGGIPQGVIDMDKAITFVEENDAIPDLPIVLFGHSWGAYSAGSVLTFHPEVMACISCAGFNASSDLIEIFGKEQAGGFIQVMMPFIRLHEWIRYGRYASSTCVDGFAATSAPIMIVQGEDDEMIPLSYGYDFYQQKFGDDPRFTFLLLPGRGHEFLDIKTPYVQSFNEKFNEWVKTLDYDAFAKENQDRFIADKAAYLKEHIDRKEWASRLDTELFDRFIAFYEQALAR